MVEHKLHRSDPTPARLSSGFSVEFLRAVDTSIRSLPACTCLGYSLLGVFRPSLPRRTVDVRAKQEVPMAETLTEHDLRRLLAVIEDGRYDHPTEGMPWAV